MKNFKKYLDKYIFLVFFLVSIPAVWALMVPGFYGASDEVHIAWLYEMYETLKLGQIPPRFVPDLSFGHGYPLFNFVFPLPFYIGSFLHFLGFSLVDSIKLVFLLSVPLSGYFMYKLLRQFSGIFLSLIGAFIYIYTPYRATDIYVRGAIGESFSFVFLPLVLLGITKLTGKISLRGLNYRWIGISAICIAALILCHNIVSYMFLPISFVYGLIRLNELGWDKRTFKSLCVSFALGLLVSGYFWIPALTESALLKYDTVFNFWDHFPAIRQLVTKYFGYGASVPGPGDGISFYIGSANLVLIALAILVLIFKYGKVEKSDKGILLWSLSIIFLSVFMMNHRSSFIWKMLPFLPYFQFPWRFLTLVSFTTPLLVIALKYFGKISGFLVIVLGVLTFPYFKPQDFLGRTDEYYLSKYIPFPQVKTEYLTHSEEYLRLPELAEKRPTSRIGLYTEQPDALVAIVDPVEDRLGIEAKIVTNSEVTLKYGKYYFPGWVVEANNQKIGAFGSPPYGDISFKLNREGEHFVKIYYKESPFRLSLDIISLAVFIFSLILILKKTGVSALNSKNI